MDVVRSNISKLSGKIEIESEVGRGSTIRIRLPLTLAILPSLVVGVGDEHFAVPQVNLTEVLQVSPEDEARLLESVRGASMLRHRGALLPLVWLAKVLDIPGVRRSDSREVTQHAAAESDWGSSLNILVLRFGDHQFGLVVDRILDTQEIVVRPLSEMLESCTVFAGATIMGDGRVAMILDVGNIAAQEDLLFHDSDELRDASTQHDSSASRHSEVLVFTSAPGEQFAIELDQILRLERIHQRQIERVGGQEFMQYRGSGLPLVRLEDRLCVDRFEPAGEELFVVIPRVATRTGILAREVVDTVHAELRVERQASDVSAISGRAVIAGRLTLFLDPGLLFEAAASEVGAA